MSRTKGKHDPLDAATGERLRTRLQQARRMKNRTLMSVAEAAGCSESLLSKIESGHACPSVSTLVRLVNTLDISVGWLFGNRDAEEPVVDLPRSAGMPGFPAMPARKVH